MSVRILSDTEAVTCEVSDDAPVDGLLHRRGGGSHRCTRWVVAREPGLRSRAAQVGEREDSRPHPQLEVIGDAPGLAGAAGTPVVPRAGSLIQWLCVKLAALLPSISVPTPRPMECPQGTPQAWVHSGQRRSAAGGAGPSSDDRAGAALRRCSAPSCRSARAPSSIDGRDGVRPSSSPRAAARAARVRTGRRRCQRLWPLPQRRRRPPR